MSPHRTKSYLRKRAHRIRGKAANDQNDDGVQGFFDHLLKTWNHVSSAHHQQETVLAGYWPIADEMDVRPAMIALDSLGILQCLPEVVDQDKPLQFRAWIPHEPLAQGPFNTFHPLPSEPLMRPDVVLVPMLAFDQRGYRLGWGGGYYDRTLDLLRKTGDVTAIGVAYASQEIDEVPRQDHDQAVDWIITEEKAIKIK